MIDFPGEFSFFLFIDNSINWEDIFEVEDSIARS